MTRKPIRAISLATVLLIVGFFSISAVAQVDNSTLTGKFVMGYQGWRACTGDGSALNSYVHWSQNGQQPSQGNVIPDMWPDTSELTAAEQFPTGFTMGNGQPAKAYSSYNATTVARHFQWMQANGLDGVLLQRFIWDVKGSGNPAMTAHHNQVALNVKAGAETYGRVFAVMYDISGEPSAQLISDMQSDWASVTGTLQLTNSARYLKHKGKPLVCIWGIGFSGFSYTTTQITTLINWFKSNGCTVLGGVPYFWRTLDGDSQTNSAWTAVYHSLDVLQPWSINRYQNESQADSYLSRLQADLADCQANGVDYMPVAFPGYSAHNLNGGALNEVPRYGGNFYWRQIYNSVHSGCSMLYGAMFDEIDEGTALYKLAPTMQTTPTPGASSFIALNVDGYSLPSDWYLRVTGEGTKVLHGDHPLTEPLPITPTNSITVTYPNGGELLTAGNNFTVTWTSSGTVGNVNIDISTDGGKSFRALAYNVANTGSKTLMVPYYGNTVCRIRVQKAVGGVPVDWSDSNFTIQVPITNPNSHLKKLWGLAAGDRTYLTESGSAERGIGYDSLSDKVFVVHHGTSINVLNGTTGADLGALNLTGVTGGNFLLDRIGVADDGVIYAGNVSVPATNASPTFKLYRWANASTNTVPTLAYSGNAGFGVGIRVGDNLTVRGAGTNTQILVGGRGTNGVSILTTANGTNFTAKVLTTSLSKDVLGSALAFGMTNTYWVKTNSNPLYRLSYNFAAGTSTTLNTFANLPPGFSAFAIDATNNLLADIDIVDGPDQLNLYDISNLGTGPSLLWSGTFASDNDNPFGVGSVCFGNNDRLYAIDANNGVLAYSVLRPPSILTQPQSQTVNQGATVSFSVVAAGSAPLSYQWKKNGTSIAGATTSAFTLVNVQAADAANYSVVVSNSTSTATSANATLTVIIPPSITTQPVSRTNNYGTTATFTVVASGTAPLSYQWQKNSVDVSGATTSALTLSSVTQNDAASYRVIVSNSAGSVTSSAATLTVNEPVINAQPASQVAPVGGSATFSVAAAGTSPLHYQWRFNAVNISGATASSYTKSNVQDADAGNYSVVVTNAYGTVKSANATLTLNHPPTLTLGNSRNTEPLVNFESFANNTPNGTVMFQRPAYSPTTASYLDTAATNYTSVTTSFPAGNTRAGGKVLKGGWTFKTGTTNPWLRLTTFNPTNVPNPTIPLDRIVRFDIYSDKSLKAGLGIRETGTTADYGANGGTTGTIEFVGVTNVVSNSPFPTRIISASTWTTLEFNFPSEPVRAFTGDGILAAGKGVLECVALVPNGGMGAYTIHLDNFEVVTTTALPGTVTMNAGSTLTFTATATDPDSGQTLTYSLDAGAPTGASINGTSGAFTWTPTSGQANSTNTITVRVKDNDAGLLSDAKTFTVIVTTDPVGVQSAESFGEVAAGESVKLEWSANPGKTYSIQFKDSLSNTDWRNAGTVTTTSTFGSAILINDGESRVYRVVEGNAGAADE